VFSVTCQVVPPFVDEATPTKSSVKGETGVTPAQQTYTLPFGPL